MFKPERVVLIKAVPTDVAAWVRFWDVAGTEGGKGSRTASVRMGRTRSGRYVILNIVKGRWSEQGVNQIMDQVAAQEGRAVPIREEREGGSAGKAVIAARARLLAGYDYREWLPVHDKVTRARGFCAQVEAGNVDVVARTEAETTAAREFIDEMVTFPYGLKDQIDAASGAFHVLTEKPIPINAAPTAVGEGPSYWGRA